MNQVTMIGTVFLDTASNTQWKIVATGDYDNNGSLDILWSNPVTGQTAAWKMDGFTRTGSMQFTTITDLNWQN